MLETLLIFAIALIPPLLSLWLMRYAEAQARRRLQAALDQASVNALRQIRPNHPDYSYLEGRGYQIGDITCHFNARSAHLRCAVNPFGPCQGCSHYQSIKFQ